MEAMVANGRSEPSRACILLALAVVFLPPPLARVGLALLGRMPVLDWLAFAVDIGSWIGAWAGFLAVIGNLLGMSLTALCARFVDPGARPEIVVPPSETRRREREALAAARNQRRMLAFLALIAVFWLGSVLVLRVRSERLLRNTTFQPRAEAPVRGPNVLEPAEGCDWIGVGGRVTDLIGAPIPGLEVRLEGQVDGSGLKEMDFTGTALEIGSGGYLFEIRRNAATASGALSVRLFHPSGAALSAPVSLSLPLSCQENQVLVDWVPVE